MSSEASSSSDPVGAGREAPSMAEVASQLPSAMELRGDDETTLTNIDWPMDMLPVEIFEIITGYLSRPEVKNLRLVCREFEAKVSARYFCNVVVPFKAELYSNLGRGEGDAFARSSSALFSSGMRIFQSFGRHILRFALSLELDEDIFSYPPIKPSQQAVPAFWGIYRWPHDQYHRYTDLEGLEQTADETEAMKDALKCLVKVTNLGLCCDAGLGFLSGPDLIARNATVLHPVFSVQNWRRPGSELEAPRQPIVAMSDRSAPSRDLEIPAFNTPMSFKRTVLQKMVAEAGYEGPQIKDAVKMMLATEGSTISSIDFDERSALLTEHDTHRSFGPHFVTIEHEGGTDVSHLPLIPSSLTRAQKEMLLELEWAHRAMIQSYVIGIIDNAADGCFDNLTTLTIAKIPSKHVYILYRHELWGNLPNLCNVSLGVIADWRRIVKPAPGCVNDYPVSPVASVPGVFKLLNDYIGAQKTIESLHFEWICGGEFAPGTFQRNHYVLPAPFFHNAELMAATNSPGAHEDQLLSLPFIRHLSLKNCWASPHVLLQTLRNMCLSSLEKLELESVSLSGPPTLAPQAPLQQQLAPQHNPNQPNHLLNLIHGLQNPGVPPANLNLPAPTPVPHIAANIAPYAHPAPAPVLPPAPVPVPAFVNVTVPAQPGVEVVHAVPIAQVLPGHPLPPAPQGPALEPEPAGIDGIQRPEWLSWASILEHFSPSIKIRNMVHQQGSQGGAMLANEELNTIRQYIPRANDLPRDEKHYTLKCISLKSCGYVAVDSTTLNTRNVLPHGAQGISGNGNPHATDFSMLMQRRHDKMFGRIVPYLRGAELYQLVEAFGMSMGWQGIYDERIINDAMTDGVESPGLGRFSGILDAADDSPREGAGQSAAQLINSFTNVNTSFL